MLNYYFNQKSQDLVIFDTEKREVLVLEVLRGIRVLTSSEMQHPAYDTEWSNSAYDPVSGKAKRSSPTCKHCGEEGHRSNHCPHGKKAQTQRPAKRAKRVCKTCGGNIHGRGTCTMKGRVEQPEQLPNTGIEQIPTEEALLI